jgi:hypothetical protein
MTAYNRPYDEFDFPPSPPNERPTFESEIDSKRASWLSGDALSDVLAGFQCHSPKNRAESKPAFEVRVDQEPS